MTMDVYAQLEQRAKRSHGESFDRLLAEARERVAALPLRPASTLPPSGNGREAEAVQFSRR